MARSRRAGASSRRLPEVPSRRARSTAACGRPSSLGQPSRGPTRRALLTRGAAPRSRAPAAADQVRPPRTSRRWRRRAATKPTSRELERRSTMLSPHPNFNFPGWFPHTRRPRRRHSGRQRRASTPAEEDGRRRITGTITRNLLTASIRTYTRIRSSSRTPTPSPIGRDTSSSSGVCRAGPSQGNIPNIRSTTLDWANLARPPTRIPSSRPSRLQHLRHSPTMRRTPSRCRLILRPTTSPLSPQTRPTITMALPLPRRQVAGPSNGRRSPFQPSRRARPGRYRRRTETVGTSCASPREASLPSVLECIRTDLRAPSARRAPRAPRVTRACRAFATRSELPFGGRRTRRVTR